MIDNNCLLCYNAACTKECGVMEPDRFLRSLYFDNEKVLQNEIDANLPCLHCDGRCERVCPNHVSIREIISSLYDPSFEKEEVDYSVLKTDFCGIPLENPFLLSSSVVSSTYEMCARALEAGWAGVCFKTICLMNIEEASPRYSAIKSDNHRLIGFKNIEQLSDKGLEEVLDIFRRLKQNYPDKFLLASFMGRNDEEWAYLTDVLSDSGADALELNFSCPNMTAEHTGSDVGQIPELVEHYSKIVAEHAKIPFIAKLTPNVTHIEESADAAIRGGADGVAAINTIKSLIEVDINPDDGIFNTAVGGYSGRAVFPIALRFIAELSKDENLDGKHISAMGGVETWKDAIKFIALGANSIQVTTSVMQYGARIIDDLKSGMMLFLKHHHFNSINEIRKSTISGVVSTNMLDRSYVIYPKFLREKCVGCLRCYLSCRDGGHHAIEIKDGRPFMNPKKCVGCHLCSLVCPKEAIVSSDVKVPKKSG